MSTPSFFRRRTIGRAASPPTWACYEQIPYDDDDDDCSDSASEDNSCSEDGEDYIHAAHTSDSENEHVVNTTTDKHDDSLDMDIDEDDERGDGDVAQKAVGFQKDVKGKQRAIEPEPESPKRRHGKKRRESVFTLRPILTIHKSQGFVWNQASPLPNPSFSPNFYTHLLPGRICLYLRISKIDVRSHCSTIDIFSLV
jgi:hypothetical protein